MDEDYTLAEVATLMRRGVERVRAMAARGDLDTAGSVLVLAWLAAQAVIAWDSMPL